MEDETVVYQNRIWNGYYRDTDLVVPAHLLDEFGGVPPVAVLHNNEQRLRGLF
jgi:hypothetical protein